MHSRDNWDDFRFVLQVSKSGSVTSAARELGVNHATVLRRVSVFEENFGIQLFDKTVRGYHLIPGHQRIVEALSEVENAVQGVSRAISGAQEPLRGNVRVTSTDTFCQTILPDIAAEIKGQAGDLHIELISSNLHIDLARMQADLTVRPANTLPEELDGDSPAHLGFALYRARGRAVDTWLGLAGPLGRSVAADWMAQNVSPDLVVAGSDSFATLREMAARGIGKTFMPCILGDRDGRLEPDPDGPLGLSIPIWVGCHRDLALVPRVRTVRQIMSQAISERAGALMGSAAIEVA